MTSKTEKEAFVWIWLPGETEPVVAGRLEADNGNILFNYGKSYLDRIGDSKPAISIYEPELPLKAGVLPLPEGLTIPGCIRDAAPDAWGRRVIINKKFGLKGADTDTAELNELTYLLESGSDRIGALDFQLSPTEYVPRIANNISMEELIESAERVEKGEPLTPELDQALFHGSSIGGARPKAVIQDQGKKYVAKFSSSSDLYSVVKAEFIAMRLAELAGLNAAPVKQAKAANKDILLIERFDRVPKGDKWARRAMVSALTLFRLDDMMARYASYETLSEIIRHCFTDPKHTLQELFSRLVFNILCGNTDDHARNHAAFWDGKVLTLTPAYDICPQGRTGNEASQAMLISGDNNLSRLKTCLETAHNFLLSEEEAREIFGNLTATIEQHWDAVCEEAELNEVDKKLLWRRQFLNPFSVKQ
ncbi:serine/threonine-protein kinase HipA [Desulfosalsimonas propionicica]|uniref:Serine/threonine-protein kinase HipA n=1 Tax=Desulfosalsimonas propionicica TaxID=332175 RepID=A0A7W0CCJ2_9BACT|nr:type II toxin-antitoxin system HipA family toxin [Desulfosalsimonas propionicica]MBA2883231.1 serine/threonine-protein kinase HipA [Desulfosalsimonas propionicica]